MDGEEFKKIYIDPPKTDLKNALKPMKLKLLNDLKLNNIFCQFNNPVMNHPTLECHSPPHRLQPNTMW